MAEGAQLLSEFMRHISPELEQPPHIQRLLEHVAPVVMGEPVRRLICMPPRHGKTTCLLHLAAFLLTRCDNVRVAYVTFAHERAKAVSRMLRRLVARTGLTLGDPLGGERSAHRWAVMATGGYLQADGVLGQWSGEGFNLIIVDDPFAGRDEAESGVIRDRTWDAFTNDLMTRQLPNGTAIVCMHTRWHLDDLAGRILAGQSGEAYEALIMPAIGDDGRELWPEVWPAERLEPFRAHAYDWASLFQQQPRPRGTAVFGEPSRFDLTEFLRGDLSEYRWAIALDPAATADTHADFSAAVLLAMQGAGDDTQAWVVDLYHRQVEVPDLVPAIVRMRREWMQRGALAKVGVESVGAQRGVYDTIRRLLPQEQCVPIKVTSDKFTRAQLVAAAWKAGRVMVPHDAPWADKLVTECMNFTGLDDPHDDMVDALAHAYRMLYRARPALERGQRQLMIYEMG